MNYEERALLGLPIITKFGEILPLSIFDYIDLGVNMQVMSFDKKRVLHEYRLNQDEQIQESPELTKSLKEVAQERTLKEIIVGLMPVYFNAYVAVVAVSLYKDIEDEEKRLETAFKFVADLEDEDFETLRMILLNINAQSEQTAFIDPMLQARKERSIKFHAKENKQEAPSIPTYISSVVTFSGITYTEVATWNYIQLVHAFQRIAQFKSYDTTTLFMTVAGDKVQPDSWDKNFKMNNDSNTSELFAVEFDTFKKNISNQLE